jgi:hypothetical protein
MTVTTPSTASRNMSASGLVTTPNQPGYFFSLRVNTVGAGEPVLRVCNGEHGQVLKTLDATPGAVLDCTDAPLFCPHGVYLEVGGASRGLDLAVNYI